MYWLWQDEQESPGMRQSIDEFDTIYEYHNTLVHNWVSGRLLIAWELGVDLCCGDTSLGDSNNDCTPGNHISGELKPTSGPLQKRIRRSNSNLENSQTKIPTMHPLPRLPSPPDPPHHLAKPYPKWSTRCETIKGCHFHNRGGRGIILKTPQAQIPTTHLLILPPRFESPRNQPRR